MQPSNHVSRFTFHVSRLASLVSCLALLVACQSTNNGAQRETAGGPVAFSVAGQSVTVAEVQQRVNSELESGVKQLLSQGQTREQITQLAEQQNVLSTIFDQIVQEELLSYEARRRGLGVDPKAVEAQLGQNQQQQAQQTLPSNDPTQLLNQRVRTARQQLVFAVIANQVKVDQFKTRHILVETEAEANDIVAQLKKGADFAELARKHSKDASSAANGGELGWVTRGSFVPEFEQAVFDERNALNTPIIVKSQYGFHVIEIEGRELQKPFENFDQLRQSQNAQQLFSEQFTPWYEQYRKDAEANGLLKMSFDPKTLTIPFPAGTP